MQSGVERVELSLVQVGQVGTLEPIPHAHAVQFLAIGDVAHQKLGLSGQPDDAICHIIAIHAFGKIRLCGDGIAAVGARTPKSLTHGHLLAAILDLTL
jgi:hypothetical protein